MPDDACCAPTYPCQGAGTLARRSSLSEDCPVSMFSLRAATATVCNLLFHHKKLLVDTCGAHSRTRTPISKVHRRWCRENGCGSVPFFPYALEIAQPSFTRKDATADGTQRTLSRIDRAFINVPIAEARDFHCHSHVTDNLGERSIQVTTQVTTWQFA